ncbi:hypothetical protein MKW94_028844 [Papaver nudicaule]|uniref:Uncharacterized protein n=1 Tax=Papaver nudicaule TaxID=74823 RepID=A0AA41VIA7_PAPNU|nr:hypothetical protein [Papaver nudicaule]
MRGAGGPLLSIGDLLSDVSEEASEIGDHNETTSSLSSSTLSISTDSVLPASKLPQLFQENYSQLSEALDGTDHSWTALTLKLCSALETADKLVQSNNSNISFLSEKVEVLESIVKRGDSAVRSANSIHDKHSNESSSTGN